ncbi:unnamed protein product [Zymoseptoria tritici ST99CH_3D7]|uniref:6-methylsalicylate decarboxylase n=1 Tax=Zymoseptoria tritici (strain ST99CH_3D7) TaxID=1276538 RepID=A0A1X7RPP8_ZYMT9|nr:unnamed protein product [Zymoseptoria tritici ST99CH_3D7]
MQFAVVNPGSLSAEGRSLVHDIDKLVGQGMPQANFGAYLGHVDPDLENSSAAYWGSNVPRLQSLKGKFDENDIFHNPQSLSFGSKVIGENYNRKPTKELLKIDTHHHFVPADLSFDFSSGPLHDFKVAASRLPRWSPSASEDYMDMAGGEGMAILSFPLLFAFPEDSQATVARKVNDYAAQLRSHAPSRFGFFAAVPTLHNPEAALAEITRSFDELKADGIVLLAKYGDKYLGHPSFAPIWKELNARSAVVFVHPGTTFRNTVINKYVDPAVADFPHETTQTALDMIMNDTVRTNSKCKIILSHAGGTLPYLIGRASSLIPFFAAHIEPPPKSAVEITEDFKLFYLDLALSSTPYVLDSLLRNFPKDRILYGSDYPFAPPPSTISLARALDSYEMDDETREMIYWRNACEIIPRLRR